MALIAAVATTCFFLGFYLGKREDKSEPLGADHVSQECLDWIARKTRSN